MTHDHWVPRKKHELVSALEKKYPGDAAKFRKMKTPQLYAIWFRLWADAGHTCCKPKPLVFVDEVSIETEPGIKDAARILIEDELKRKGELP